MGGSVCFCSLSFLFILFFFFWGGGGGIFRFVCFFFFFGGGFLSQRVLPFLRGPQLPSWAARQRLDPHVVIEASGLARVE